MQIFGDIIVQTIVVDMVSSFVMTVSQLEIEARNNDLFHGTGNSWLNVSGQMSCIWAVVFAGVTNVNFWSVPIQALYRYILIVRRKRIRFWYAASVYAIVSIMTLFCGLPTLFITTPIYNTPDSQKLQTMAFWQTYDVQKFCIIPAVYLSGMSHGSCIPDAFDDSVSRIACMSFNGASSGCALLGLEDPTPMRDRRQNLCVSVRGPDYPPKPSSFYEMPKQLLSYHLARLSARIRAMHCGSKHVLRHEYPSSTLVGNSQYSPFSHFVSCCSPARADDHPLPGW
uniref:G_PROTEIN_RECEP_F1_2 domain-containing protein n=1 Tax=Panagrellus redivivus TaxID=6233 RepID=A0A7E4VHK7_PANRE